MIKGVLAIYKVEGWPFEKSMADDSRGLWLKVHQIYIRQFRESIGNGSDGLWLTILRNNRTPSQ